MPVFEEVVGQENAVDQLSWAATQTRPHHAWLITGPPGSGRSVAARAFAAALQCQRAALNERGCGACAACREVLAGNHPDVTSIATEAVTIKIDEARELVASSFDKPSSGRWRVLIVEDADRMLERSTNVLLKAIEEPPPHTIWILCAPSPADVLVTIRSRCRNVNLQVPAVAAVAQLLHSRDDVPHDIAEVSARLAQSHIGIARHLASDASARQRRTDIVSLPAKLTSVSAAMQVAKSLVKLADEEAQSSLAQRDHSEREQLLHTMGVASGESVPAKLRAQVKRLEEEQTRRAKRSKSDYYDRALTDLLSLYRDVLLIQLGAPTPIVNEEMRTLIARIAEDSEPETTLHRMQIINSVRKRLVSTNVAPQLAVEAMTIQLL